MGKALIENKNITILSCSQTDTKGRPSKSSGRYKQYAWSKKIAQSASCHSESKHENLEQVDWVSGSVVMISRANFEKHQGWNEDYWMYCEDEDFCRRVNNNGGSVYLLKSASIIHAHGGSSRINPRTAALTKTEVLISTHLYFHNFLEGSSKSLLNAYIVTSNLITHLLLAVIALPLFFIRKMRIKFLMLFFLLHYYCKAMISGNWKSPRIQK